MKTKRSDSGLLVPDVDDAVGIKGIVHIALFDGDMNLKDEEWIHNLVTTKGDEYYSERAAAIASPPDQVSGMQLGTGVTAAAKSGAGSFIGTFITGSNVAIDGTYPQSNNSGVITWRSTWGAGVATNAAITEAAIIITNPLGTVVAAAATTISRTTFTAKDKQAADSLVITWTHTLLGA